jgi:hypothetical protein
MQRRYGRLALADLDEGTMNYLRTAMLLAGLTALFMGVGYLIGGQSGAMIALLIAAAMNLFTYWNADKLVLSMHDAHEVDERTAPEFVGLVRELAQRAGLPMPRVYLMDNPQPNAFATGRNPENAAVAATTGLLNMLSREEIAGVMAHELSHIKHRDTLIMTITATIAGAISMLAQVGLFFGGNRDKQQRRDGDHRHARDGHPGADRGHAGADGDFPHARICGRQCRAPDRERAGRAQSGDSPPVHHQPALGRAHGQSVRDPSALEYLADDMGQSRGWSAAPAAKRPRRSGRGPLGRRRPADRTLGLSRNGQASNRRQRRCLAAISPRRR